MTANPPKPVGIKAPLGAPWVEIAWSDGVTQRLPNVILRGYCPCAKCQGHSGPLRYVEGHDTELSDIGRVGNYALRLSWADGHDTGIYAYPHLRLLGDLHDEHGADLPLQVPELSRR